MYEMVSKKSKRKEIAPAVHAGNRTGIPDGMKARFEQGSGFSFDDVRVQYHSDKPAQLQAFAYTQGNRVYLGPGQEKHLEHELGHVVQQKQGRVGITSFLNGVGLNEDPAMEREADAYARSGGGGMGVFGGARPAGPGAPVQLQRWRWVSEDGDWEPVELEDGEVTSEKPNRAGTLNGEILDTSTEGYVLEQGGASMNQHGANQSATLHSKDTTKLVTGDVSHKLTAMYEDDKGKRRRRRFGEAEDIHRFLRWLSTFLSVQYQISGEVQCYYDVSRKIIFVSTNNYRELGRLGKGLLPLPARVRPKTARQIRHHNHWDNLAFLLNHYNRAFGTFREIIVSVIPDDPELDRKSLGTHAEQRILHYLKKESEEIKGDMIAAGAVEVEDGRLKLKPEYLGGLRRACFACARICHSAAGQASIHPGPFWPSKASLGGAEKLDLVKISEGITEQDPTYVTFEAGQATLDHDTDSGDEDLGMDAYEDEEDEKKSEVPYSRTDWDFYARVLRAMELE